MNDAAPITKVSVDVFRAPAGEPVRTSFGAMNDRRAVFVRLEDRDGAFGWGEIFANWPAAGAEHRGHLLIRDIAGSVLGFQAGQPGDLWHHLRAATRVRVLQSGEWGPFRQVLAGLDTAMHDLAARRMGVPLARMLSDKAVRHVPVYASGIPVGQSPERIAASRECGIGSFKVKLGFEHESDLKSLEIAADDLALGERLFADANQAWTLPQAQAFVQNGVAAKLGWIEEPIRADCPDADWIALAAKSPIPLACGENIAGFDAFTGTITSGAVRFIQPDIAKWGGVTGCLNVARQALAAGRVYCPHFLGGGIGLIASAHLLAAAGGSGLLELDTNPNPLRSGFFSNGETTEGGFAIANSPGLGVETLPEAIGCYRTLFLEAAA